jgi:hypothetical protein
MNDLKRDRLHCRKHLASFSLIVKAHAFSLIVKAHAHVNACVSLCREVPASLLITVRKKIVDERIFRCSHLLFPRYSIVQ